MKRQKRRAPSGTKSPAQKAAFARTQGLYTISAIQGQLSVLNRNTAVKLKSKADFVQFKKLMGDADRALEEMKEFLQGKETSDFDA